MVGEFDKSALAAANQALNKILGFNSDRHKAASSQVPPTHRLYHYTTADGLRGIIENDELWATSAYYLNDSAEITYGCEIVSEALDSWLSEQIQDKKSFAVMLGENLQIFFRRDLLDIGGNRVIFLACFCENDNLLSQWRTYGQSGGYSIGFAVPPFQIGIPSGMVPEPVIYTSKWVKVIYDKINQLTKCREVLDGTLGVLNDTDTGQAIVAVDRHGQLGSSAFLRIIADMLLEEAVAFKDEAFKVENEWRVVVRPRELLKQANDDGGETPVPLYFRTSKGMIVPYVKILPTKGHRTKLPIVGVRTGPTLDKKTAAFAISSLLQVNSYSGVDVTGSDITVRL
jgi:hypothetical protein